MIRLYYNLNHAGGEDITDTDNKTFSHTESMGFARGRHADGHAPVCNNGLMPLGMAFAHAIHSGSDARKAHAAPNGFALQKDCGSMQNLVGNVNGYFVFSERNEEGSSIVLFI